MQTVFIWMGIGKYSTRPRIKVWTVRRTPYFLDISCIFHTARQWTPFVFSHTTVQIFQWCRKCTVDRHDHWWQRTIRWRIADAQSTAFTCYTACTYTCSTVECGISWYRYTSHSENTASECEKICKRCSFECGIGKYSTRPRNNVWAIFWQNHKRAASVSPSWMWYYGLLLAP